MSGPKHPICCLCKKPIKGRVYLQGGSALYPVHKRCRIVIKRDKRTGGI